MHPALSVIFFTVTSGAGYGLLMLLALCRQAELAPGMTSKQLVVLGIFGLVLVTAGLLSSTFHLANPKNAWRSFTRFRTSWLSREAVFAVLFYPVCLLWLSLEWFSADGAGVLVSVMAVATGALAFVVLVCTAMIYASLKTIRQWNTALTPVNFVLLGVLLGSLILLVCLRHQALPMSGALVVSVVVLCVAALVKLIYFAWIGQPAGPTINTALGFTRATVRLLDVGHASDTFLTKEFGYQVERTRLIWIRILCVVFAFVLPLALLSLTAAEPSVIGLLLAAVSAYVGVFMERWLFFAEARHVVNLYHGASRT